LDSTSAAAPAAELIAEAEAAGVERIVAIGTGLDSSEQAIALAHRHPGVSAVIGVHPHDADRFGPDDERWIRELGSDTDVVGVGECGLDYFRDLSDHAAQRRAFSAQIGIARDLGLPIDIHSRAAEQDTLDVLRSEAAGHPVVLHCFGMPGRIDDVLSEGWTVSFAGNVTFKKADDLRAAARLVPEDHLLVETDSPYLAPVPMRGKPNRPAYVRYTLEAIAEIRGTDPEELARTTTANAHRVFGW
jgi:TatD DNase family protein